MKNVYLQRLLKFTALLLPLAIVVLLFQNYVYVFGNDNTERLRKFYLEEENSLDVVIVGASETHCAYIPGYAYQQYGYTSYLYSIDGNIGSFYASQLEEIFSHQDPGLILIEIGSLVRPEDPYEYEAKLRMFVEPIPPSHNKLNTIMNADYDDKISCIFPFFKYHGDWEIATINLARYCLYPTYINSPCLLKGAHICCHQYVPGSYQDNEDPYDLGSQFTGERKDILLELLQYCRQNKLDNVIFVNFPRCFQDESHSDYLSNVKQFQQIVEDEGFEFLDLQPLIGQMGLDLNRDFSSIEHLNAFGQEKFTKYLGSLIMDRYQLTPTAQSPKNRRHWENSSTFANRCLDIGQEQILAGNEVSLCMDTDLLPYLEESDLEMIKRIHREYFHN